MLTYRQTVIHELRRSHPNMTVLQADQQYQTIYARCGKVSEFHGGIAPKIRVFKHGCSYTVELLGASFYQGHGFTVRSAYQQALWRKRFMRHSAQERNDFFWDWLGYRQPEYVSFHNGMIA